MTDSEPKQTGWRWGVNRWIVLATIVLGFVLAGQFPPLRPHVQLPAESLTGTLFTLPVIGDFQLTNTHIGMLLGDLVLVVIALSVNRAVRRGDQILTGFNGAVEAMIEALHNLTETTAGKWAKAIFPWMATIFLIVVIANWSELFPAVDSVGLLEPDHAPEGANCSFDTLFHLGSTEVVAVGGEDECSSAVVPFVRVLSTDLNFTVGLALISVVASQVIGVRSLGAGYFTKFFNVKTLFTRPMFGAIDFVVGILETILEAMKVLSFAFRLFGNIFAGSILLFVIGSLIPVFAQSAVLLFEFFIGIIQALIFSMLTLIFMSLATAGHGEGEEH